MRQAREGGQPSAPARPHRSGIRRLPMLTTSSMPKPRLVETAHGRVFRPDQQIDLGAAQLQQLALGRAHQCRGMATPAAVRRHCKVVDPAAMPVIPGHCRGHDASASLAHQEQPGLHRQLAGHVLRVVPGPRQAAVVPQLDDGGLVGRMESADVQIVMRHASFLKKGKRRPDDTPADGILREKKRPRDISWPSAMRRLDGART